MAAEGFVFKQEKFMKDYYDSVKAAHAAGKPIPPYEPHHHLIKRDANNANNTAAQYSSIYYQFPEGYNYYQEPVAEDITTAQDRTTPKDNSELSQIDLQKRQSLPFSPSKQTYHYFPKTNSRRTSSSNKHSNKNRRQDVFLPGNSEQQNFFPLNAGNSYLQQTNQNSNGYQEQLLALQQQQQQIGYQQNGPQQAISSQYPQGALSAQQQQLLQYYQNQNRLHPNNNLKQQALYGNGGHQHHPLYLPRPLVTGLNGNGQFAQADLAKRRKGDNTRFGVNKRTLAVENKEEDDSFWSLFSKMYFPKVNDKKKKSRLHFYSR